MKKVERGNKQFKIIPEAKTVIGKEPGKCIADDFKYGFRKIDKDVVTRAATALGITWGDIFFDKIDDVSANSYCDERDEWDEKIGVDVCSSKLDMKQHIKLAKQYSRIYRLLQEASAIVYKMCEVHVKKAKAIEDDLINHYGRLKV